MYGKAIFFPHCNITRVGLEKGFTVQFNLFLFHKEQWWGRTLEDEKHSRCLIWGFSAVGIIRREVMTLGWKAFLLLYDVFLQTKHKTLITP